MNMDFHAFMGKLGGKKFIAFIIGIICWLIAHFTKVSADQIHSIAGQVADAANTAANTSVTDSSVTGLITLVASYIFGQGLADGLTGGKTSSVVATQNADSVDAAKDVG
jgi:hypothetical protein